MLFILLLAVLDRRREVENDQTHAQHHSTSEAGR